MKSRQSARPSKSLLLVLAAALPALAGCSLISHLGTDLSGADLGKTFYLGGAGTLGHVGTLDVPRGLRDAGYHGAIEVVGWQSWLGGTARDQIDRGRNRREADRFARQILDYLDEYPDRPVNIIALSAGSGIAAWAIERLPPDKRVATVVFLASSLSRHYDMTDVLNHAEHVYNFHHSRDPILRYLVPLAGTVDRRYDGCAGQYGFAWPPHADDDTRRLYKSRLRNMPPSRRYVRFGYDGGHTDGVRADFIREVVAPLLHQYAGPQAATRPAEAQPATQPRRAVDE